MRTITQEQLAAALPRAGLPGGFQLPACPAVQATPAELAAAIFEVAGELEDGLEEPALNTADQALAPYAESARFPGTAPEKLRAAPARTGTLHTHSMRARTGRPRDSHE
jgi:hypothetical protein